MDNHIPEMLETLQRMAKWGGDLKKSDNYFSKLKKIAKYYEVELPFIMAHHEKRPRNLYRAYPYNWSLVHTPIEEQAWICIRTEGHIPLYPQFPAHGFHIDFAAPHMKIGLELDGAQWHDEGKDRKRDGILKSHGWKIYRITGREMSRVIDNPFHEPYRTMRELKDLLPDFILNTGEGVIMAMRALIFGGQVPIPNCDDYYIDPSDLEWQVRNLFIETLENHTYFNSL